MFRFNTGGWNCEVWSGAGIVKSGGAGIVKSGEGWNCGLEGLEL